MSNKKISDLLKKVKIKFSNGYYVETISLLNQVIKSDSQSIHAYLLLGISYILSTKDLDKNNNHKTKNGNNKSKRRNHKSISNNTTYEQKIQKAVENLDKVITLAPNNILGYLTRANCYVLLKDYDNAIKLYDKIIELSNQKMCYMGKAFCFYSLKKYEEAIKHYNQVIPLDYNSFNDLIPYFPFEDIPVISNTELDKHNLSNYLYRGIAYFKLDRFNDAINDFNEVTNLDPKNINGYFLRANCYVSTQNYHDAISDFNDAIQLDPKNIDGYLGCANCHLFLNQYNSAIEYFTKALTLDEKNIGGYLGRGTCYLYSDKYKDAINNFNKVIKLDEKNIEGYLGRAKCYSFLSKYDNAIEDFTKALRLDDTNIGAYLNRANCYRFVNQGDEAIKDFSKILILDPKNIGVYLNRANCYVSFDQYNDAINDYNKVIEIDSKAVLAYLYRGVCYYTLKKYELAINDFESARKFSHTFLDLTSTEYITQNIEFYCSGIRTKYESIKQTIFTFMTKENISENTLQKFKQLNKTILQDFFLVEQSLMTQSSEFLCKLDEEVFNHISMVKHKILNEISNYIHDINAIKNMRNTKNIRFINTLEDLISIKAESFNKNKVFRGMNRASWLLTPNIFRGYGQQTKYDLLQNFKREASALSTINFSHYTTVDWISLMQHHGCKTPLLDWTQSFAIALFFSKHAEKPNTDPQGIPIIYTYTCDEIKLDIDVNAYIDNDYNNNNKEDTTPEIIFFAPNNHHTRAYIQKSMFSYHMENASIDELLNSKNMTRYIINPILIDNIDNILQIDQINISSIYPDLEHLSLRLNDTYSRSNINFAKQPFKINMPKMSDIMKNIDSLIDSPIYNSIFKFIDDAE